MQGLKLDICTENRMGLLSDVTRVFRENGLTVSRAEIGTTTGGKATGSFYVRDVSRQEVNPRTVELVRQELGGSTLVVNRGTSSWNLPPASSSSSKVSRSSSSSGRLQTSQKPSLGTLLWSHFEKLSSNFGSIRS